MATEVVLLWHMHQPHYGHPATGAPALPWVRLHAASGYLDMARALERHPGARVTVNFVPALVEQLEALVQGQRDPLELLAERAADTLDERERATVLARSFSTNWHRGVLPRARYVELAARRQGGVRAFDTAAIRDVQCLFLLSWLGPAARADHPIVSALDAKGRDFSEADKAALLAATRAAAAAVLPAWRNLAARGQIELCASPYHHPIMPLLVDSTLAHVSRPGDVLPPRFAWPEDADAQLALALAAHARVFGGRPQGMWPPEGSVAPAALARYAAAGVKWLVTDEGVLERSLAAAPTDAAGLRGAPRTHAWRAHDVTLLFRDRELSDRIGFRYADAPATAAVNDLLGAARTRNGDGLAVIALDGENAWESYPRRGADFLDALYARLERGGDLVSRTVSEVVQRGGARPLSRLHAGSWIDADFHIWIGDPVKNRAWTLLGAARSHVAAAGERRGKDDAAVRAALAHLYAAEASDWFWWFGEPFSSSEDALFDELFRARLAAAYRALGDAPPDALEVPVDDHSQPARDLLKPTALIRPRLDGRIGYYEWRGAARHEMQGGAMADGSRPLEAVLVGFDLEHLYLCLEPGRMDRRRVAAARLHLEVTTPAGARQVAVQLGAADGGAAWRALGGGLGSGDVVELSVPFAALGVKAKDDLRLAGRVEFADVDIARFPAAGSLRLTAPWPGFGDDDWRV